MDKPANNSLPLSPGEGSGERRPGMQPDLPVTISDWDAGNTSLVEDPGASARGCYAAF
jgi:hypothetical protein